MLDALKMRSLRFAWIELWPQLNLRASRGSSIIGPSVVLLGQNGYLNGLQDAIVGLRFIVLDS